MCFLRFVTAPLFNQVSRCHARSWDQGVICRHGVQRPTEDDKEGAPADSMARFPFLLRGVPPAARCSIECSFLLLFFRQKISCGQRRRRKAASCRHL